MKFTLASLFVFSSVSVTQAALIVNLDPADARFDSLIDNDDGTGGFNAGDPGAQNVNGLTFNVTFTPSAGDLDSSTSAVNILEIGGDANGSGLYLLGGELYFISKMNGTGVNTLADPLASNDLNFASGNNMIGVRSSFGPLTAGVEYSAAILFDPITAGTLEIGILPELGSLTLDSFTLSGVGGKTNWDGDNSASAFRGNPPNVLGNFGGASQGAATDPWSEVSMNGNPFEGIQGQALYWTLDNAEIVPEPSATLLVLLGGLAIGVRRSRG